MAANSQNAYAVHGTLAGTSRLQFTRNGGFTYQQFRATRPSVFVFAVIYEYMLCSFPARHDDLPKSLCIHYRKHAGNTNFSRFLWRYPRSFPRLEKLRGFQPHGLYRITSNYIPLVYQKYTPLDRHLYIYIGRLPSGFNLQILKIFSRHEALHSFCRARPYNPKWPSSGLGRSDNLIEGLNDT